MKTLTCDPPRPLRLQERAAFGIGADALGLDGLPSKLAGLSDPAPGVINVLGEA
jgi:hypothetical protein